MASDLSSLEALLPFDWYQFKPLGDRSTCVWTTCPRLVSECRMATSYTRKLCKLQVQCLNLLQHHEPTRSLRSSSSYYLSVPHHNLKFGSRAFRYSAPKVWNSLTVSIRESQSLLTFRRHLKTWNFQSAYPSQLSILPRICDLILLKTWCYLSHFLTYLNHYTIRPHKRFWDSIYLHPFQLQRTALPWTRKAMMVSQLPWTGLIPRTPGLARVSSFNCHTMKHLGILLLNTLHQSREALITHHDQSRP